MFYLDHRSSYDLDLFTGEQIDSQQLRNQLLRLCESIGADCEPVQTSPDFHRFELKRGEEREVIDFVHDRLPQRDQVKENFGPIRVDTLREIIDNKWGALVGRTELKDLVDLYFLEKAGHEILSHLPDAGEKDRGFEPAIVSHLLASAEVVEVPDFMIEDLDLDDFRSFLKRVRKELALRALPPQER